MNLCLKSYVESQFHIISMLTLELNAHTNAKDKKKKLSVKRQKHLKAQMLKRLSVMKRTCLKGYKFKKPKCEKSVKKIYFQVCENFLFDSLTIKNPSVKKFFFCFFLKRFFFFFFSSPFFLKVLFF